MSQPASPSHGSDARSDGVSPARSDQGAGSHRTPRPLHARQPLHPKVNPTPSAWQAAELIRNHQTMVWRYLRYLGADAQQAEDLTQETFLAYLRGGLAERDGAATAAWLRRVAHNLLRKAWRTAQRRPEEALPDDVQAGQAESVWLHLEGDDMGQQRRDALAGCLDGLGPKARQAVELRYRDKVGRAGIAAALGLQPEGVKALLRRARNALRECVERAVGLKGGAAAGGIQ